MQTFYLKVFTQEAHEEQLTSTALKTCELHHAKTGLKIIVVIIPKEGLGGTSPAKPSFEMTPIIKLYSVVFTSFLTHARGDQKK